MHPEVQRRGIGRAILRRVNLQVARGHDFGALAASEEGLALHRAAGWDVRRGPLGVRTPGGIVPTPEEAGGVLVYAPAGDLDFQLPLTCAATFAGGRVVNLSRVPSSARPRSRGTRSPPAR
ncbi:hypothetical protein HNQ09_002523 [Deinococcus budaensis]|uniref:N-acetyltransferase domain-containing protein n=1 Tax=Deinococcus budaensis TaxID=1665626 RepID=A0A7W8GGC0_9DEIO|nr:hypothetical protein [Deinococcus budaensis]